MFFTLLYKCFSLSALSCEEKGCFYAKLFVMTLWSGLISRRGLDSHWRNMKFTSLGNQDSLIITFLGKKKKKKCVSVHNNFCIYFVLLCVKSQLLRKDLTREKQNVFSHFSWKPMSWCIVLPNLCAGSSSILPGCAGIRCPEGNLFGYICIHKEGSTVGTYLQLETVAAKDLVHTVCVFGKGRLL